MASVPPGKLVVLSGPSGVGKTTVLGGLFEKCSLPLVRSVSATTRPPREGEQDGVDYYFLTEDEFSRRRRAGEFLECFQVYGRGHWYGTLESEVASGLAAGKWVVLGIDVQGAAAVVEKFPDTITIFLRPSSWEELEARLRNRQTETEEEIQKRLARARSELALADRYRYQVVNDCWRRAVDEICSILKRAPA